MSGVHLALGKVRLLPFLVVVLVPHVRSLNAGFEELQGLGVALEYPLAFLELVKLVRKEADETHATEDLQDRLPAVLFGEEPLERRRDVDRLPGNPHFDDADARFGDTWKFEAAF